MPADGSDFADRPSLDRRGFLALCGAARRASAMSRTSRLVPAAATIETASTADTRFYFCGTVSGGDEVVSCAIWRWTHEAAAHSEAFYVPTAKLIEISRPATAAP